MPQADHHHTPVPSRGRSAAADMRECVRGVRQLWTQVQADAQAEREGDRDLVRSLRKAVNEEAPV